MGQDKQTSGFPQSPTIKNAINGRRPDARPYPQSPFLNRLRPIPTRFRQFTPGQSSLPRDRRVGLGIAAGGGAGLSLSPHRTGSVPPI